MFVMSQLVLVTTDRLIVLKQRRDRRRLKKDIVAPKSPTKSSSESEVVEGTQTEATNISKPVGKKAKAKESKSRLPAGLALMHGFSAKNVSKHRLTVHLESFSHSHRAELPPGFINPLCWCL